MPGGAQVPGQALAGQALGLPPWSLFLRTQAQLQLLANFPLSPNAELEAIRKPAAREVTHMKSGTRAFSHRTHEREAIRARAHANKNA